MKRVIFTYIMAATLLLTACAGKIEAPKETSQEVSRAVETEISQTVMISETEAVTEKEDIREELLAREKRTVIKGNGEDVFTVMVYICGTDLETDMGAATADILEMCGGGKSEKVNLLLYTGGTNEWQNNFFRSDTNQIWKVNGDEIECVEEDMGTKSMTDPETLTEFVRYCAEKFPANRNVLILWDHGGGALYGYGSDEIFGGDPMSICDIDKALEKAGVYFDLIGFDACLMANIETAYMMSRHGDYLIASEETEPSGGWHYTGWIKSICEDSSADTESIGKIIADDMIEKSCNINSGDIGTVSVIDLTKTEAVIKALNDFSKDAEECLENSDFFSVSRSRSDTRSFGGDEYDIIDLADFAKNLGADSSKKLIEAVKEAAVYSVCTENTDCCNGISVYLPFKNISAFGGMTDIYRKLGFEGEYTDFAAKFATLVAGGQANSAAAENPFGVPSGGHGYNQWESYDWFDSEYAANYGDSYGENTYGDAALEVEDRGDYFALALSDSDWDILSDIKMQIFYDDGEGYIDMGTDSYFEVDDDGALMVDYDGLWFTFNNTIVPFYIDENAEGYLKGTIHCLLNDEEVDLVVLWDDSGNGSVMGAQRHYSTGVSGKGLIPVNDGDRIQLICGYYTYEGEYEDDYFYAEEFYFDSSMNVYYSPSAAGDYLLYYVLGDLYNNIYYTEAVVLSFDDEFFYENYPEYYE